MDYRIHLTARPDNFTWKTGFIDTRGRVPRLGESFLFILNFSESAPVYYFGIAERVEARPFGMPEIWVDFDKARVASKYSLE